AEALWLLIRRRPPEEYGPERYGGYERQARTLGILTKVYFFRSRRKLVWSMAISMNLARRLNSPPLLSRTYSVLGVGLLAVGFPRASRACFRRSMHAAFESSDPRTQALALEYKGLWNMYMGDPEGCLF